MDFRNYEPDSQIYDATCWIMKMQRAQSLIINIFILVCALVLVFSCIELGFRFANISYPSFYTYNEVLGYKPVPNTAGWYYGEVSSFISMNEHGFRDTNHSYDKPENTYRILILGDSFSEGKQVSLENTYWKHIERALKVCPSFKNTNIEMINLGVGGYGTLQQYLMLQQYGWLYDPDFIVLQIYINNDIMDNSVALSPTSVRPLMAKTATGFTILNTHTTSSNQDNIKYAFKKRIHRLGKRFRSIQFIENTIDNFIINITKPRSVAKIETPEYMDQIHATPTRQVWIEAWEIFETLLTFMRAETVSRNIPFLAFATSTPLQVYPDKDFRNSLAQRYNLDIMYQDERLESFGKQNDIEMLTLGQKMQKIADETGVFFHGFESTILGDGHWNRYGHEAAGIIVSQKICDMLYSKSL